MIPATRAVTSVTPVAFGAAGGLMLLVALDGFGESTGGVAIVVYAPPVLAGNFAAARLFNWLIARRRYAGARGAGWPPAPVALGVTGVDGRGRPAARRPAHQGALPARAWVEDGRG
jgi:hypothetical protein